MNTKPNSQAVEAAEREKFDGHAVIEAALKRATKGNLADAPFPLTGEVAEAYLMGAASAYQHALEMIPSALTSQQVAAPIGEPIAYLKAHASITAHGTWESVPADDPNGIPVYAVSRSPAGVAGGGDASREQVASVAEHEPDLLRNMLQTLGFDPEQPQQISVVLARMYAIQGPAADVGVGS